MDIATLLEEPKQKNLPDRLEDIGLRQTDVNPLGYIITDSNFIEMIGYNKEHSIFIYVIYNPDRRQRGRQNPEARILGFSTDYENSAIDFLKDLFDEYGKRRNFGLIVEHKNSEVYIGYLSPFQNPSTPESKIRTDCWIS